MRFKNKFGVYLDFWNFEWKFIFKIIFDSIIVRFHINKIQRFNKYTIIIIVICDLYNRKSPYSVIESLVIFYGTYLRQKKMNHQRISILKNNNFNPIIHDQACLKTIRLLRSLRINI